MNPTLSDLVGGINAVTLSDEEARRRGTRKTVLERKAPPTFDVLIEINDRDRLAIHHNVADTSTRCLRGYAPQPEMRQRMPGGSVAVVQEAGTRRCVATGAQRARAREFAARRAGRRRRARRSPSRSRC